MFNGIEKQVIMVPQLIVLGFYGLGLGISLSKHGEPQKSNYNFFTFLIARIIMAIILYYGGFWDVLIK